MESESEARGGCAAGGIPPLVTRAVWWVLLVAAVAWYGFFRVAAPLRHEPFSPSFNGNDFKHLYLGAWMLVRGQDPYDADALRSLAWQRGFRSVNPYVYLPLTGLVMSPLTLLDPPDALRVWFVLNHLFLAAALALTFWSLGLRPTLQNITVVVSLAALYYPLHRTLTAGQLNCALLFLFALVFALETRGWFVAAGAVAAFAFLFKLMPGILLIYFACRWVWALSSREARAGKGYLAAAVSMVVFSAVLSAASIMWVGWGRHVAFAPLLRDMSYGRSTWAEFGQHFYRDPTNQSFNSLFHHLLVMPTGKETTPWLVLGPAWANALTLLAAALCWLLVAWVEARACRRRRAESALGRTSNAMRPSRASATYSLFILLGLLTPSIYWDHYAVIALWPLLACYARLSPKARPAALAVMILLALPLGSFLGRSLVLLALTLLAGFAAIVFLLVCRGRHGLFAALWGIAAAMLAARFPFDLGPFRQGAGLLAMSLTLWGTLLLFALCLVSSRQTDEAR